MAVLVDSLGNARLCKATLANVRRQAAKSGFAINQVKTVDDATGALVEALPIDLAEDMLNFIESKIAERDEAPLEK